MNVLPGGGPGTNTDSDHGPAPPGGAATPAFSGKLNVLEGGIRLRIVFTGNQDLIEGHLVVDPKALLLQALGEVPGVFAELFNELGYTGSTQSLQDRPELNGPSSLGHGGGVIHGVPPRTRLEVGRGGPKGSKKRLSLSTEDDPAVIGNVEGFVGIHCP